MEALRVTKQEEAAKSAGAASQVAAAAQEAKARKPKVSKVVDSSQRQVLAMPCCGQYTEENQADLLGGDGKSNSVCGYLDARACFLLDGWTCIRAIARGFVGIRRACV